MATIRDTRDSGPGVALQVIDYPELELIATANAQGVAYVASDPIDPAQLWRVERIVVNGDSANTCEVTVYQNYTVTPQRARDWSPIPPGFVAIAEYPSFLTILAGSCVALNITGANPGDLFNITVQYQLVAKTAAT
jgi:acetyl esterase/lipase